MQILSIPDKCTGCSACKSVCPAECIEIKLDVEGFLFPFINSSRCTECYECEKVCPALNKNRFAQNNWGKKAYYGWNKDDSVRKNSSSGGVFSVFAEHVLSLGGVVYGAVYDEINKEVIHVSSNEIAYQKQRKSKYVESNVNDTFIKVQYYLKKGINVLYSGTPCQIAGLKSFLNMEYDNLLTLDFVCLGVGPMKLLSDHINYLENIFKSKVANLDFRPKTFGWSQQYIKIDLSNNRKYFKPYVLDRYFKGYYSKIFLRRCCYQCAYRQNHESDIILADFWGINRYKPEINDEKGISLLLTNSSKGKYCLEKVLPDLELFSLDMKYAEYAFQEKVFDAKLRERNNFFKLYYEVGFEKAANKTYMKGTFKYQVKYMIKRLLLKTNLYNYLKALVRK